MSINDQEPFDPLQSALDKAVHALRGCGSDTDEINPEIFADVLNNIAYFHKNLRPPANMYDFVQYAKTHLNYEVYQPGTIIMRPGDIASKVSIIIKGNVHKIQVRAYEDIDREFKKKHPHQVLPREDLKKQFTIPEEDEKTEKKALPRYLQHTLSTNKKANNFRLGHYIMAMSQLENGESKPADGQKGLSRSLSNLDSQAFKFNSKGNKSGAGANEATSLNDLDSTAGRINESQVMKTETSKPNFRRIQTMKAIPKADSMAEIKADSEEDEGEAMERRMREQQQREGEPSHLGDISTFHEDDKEFIDLLKLMAPKYPDIRFFLCDVARMKKVKTYKPGDCIGEHFFREYRKKENLITLSGSDEVHVLTMSREHYRSILTEMFENAKEKVEFFIDLLPSFDEETVRKFSYNFCEREFKKNEQIYTEDDPSGDVFVLKTGNVKLYKEFEAHPQVNSFSTLLATSPRRFEKTELPIASIIDKQFFGEEILLHEEKRFCSAMAVTAGTMAYFIEPRVYNMVKASFSDLLKVLRHQTRERFEWRQQRAIDLMEQKKQLQLQVKPPVLGPKIVEKTQKSLSAASTFLVTSKSVRNTDSMKLIQFSDEADERKAQELQQLRSMVLKTNKVLVMENASVVKNLALYKDKFSRKTKNTEKDKVEQKYMKLKAQELGKGKAVEEPVEEELTKFNLRKQFDKKANKLRLPSINTNVLPIVNRGSETTRNLTSKDKEQEAALGLSMVVPTTSRKPTKSTILDYFGIDEEDLNNFKNHKPKKVKEIVPSIGIKSAVFGSGLKEQRSPSYVTPRNFLPEEREELVENSGLASLKPIKKTAANNKWRAKVSEGVKSKEEISLTGIVGKKTEFSLKL